MTGYWKSRGFFTVYIAGKKVARVPTPEQAKDVLRQAGHA